MEGKNKWRRLYRRWFLSEDICQPYYSSEASPLCRVHACMYQILVWSSLCYLQNHPLGIRLQCWNYVSQCVCGAPAKSHPSKIFAEQKLFPAISHPYLFEKSAEVRYEISKLTRCEKIHAVWVSLTVNLSRLVLPWKRRDESLSTVNVKVKSTSQGAHQKCEYCAQMPGHVLHDIYRLCGVKKGVYSIIRLILFSSHKNTLKR